MQEPQPTAVRPPTRQLEPEPEWPAIGVSISLAAMVYPALVSLVALPLILLSVVLGWNVLSLQEFFEAAIQFFVVVFLVGGAALFTTAVLCVPVLFLVWVTLAALGTQWAWPTKGVVAGGTVGYTYFALYVYFAFSELPWRIDVLARNNEWLYVLGVTLLGPVLAVFLGQVGGACGGLGLEQKRREAGHVEEADQQKRGTFSVRQLLGLTLVMSVAFAAMRLLGLLNPAAMLTLGFWLVLEIAGYYPALKLARRLRRSRRFGALLSMPATPTSLPPAGHPGV